MRLIDADAIIPKGTRITPDNVDVATAIRFAPTVDAVPVVRCRECKWWHEDDDIGHCDNPDGLDNYAKPEDFCSYGKWKGGADNR